VYRRREKLEIPSTRSRGVEEETVHVECSELTKLTEEGSVIVPFSFRVLATMNNYDRALLFKLGYALTRRFAIINYNYLEDISKYCAMYSEKALEGTP